MMNSGSRGTHGPTDDLAAYSRAVRRFPPLTRAEEHAVAVRARRGDAAAVQQLVRHNLAFVIAVVRRQRCSPDILDDLIQEGNVGLLHAAERFDPHAGTRFCTYAVWWIRAFVGRYLRASRSSVRPRSGTVAQADASLDALVGEFGDVTALDLIPDEGPGSELRYFAAEHDRAVRAALVAARARIGELGWNIVHERLQSDTATTLEAIASRWRLSRERVRQVEVRTKRLLHRHLGAMRLDAGV